RSNGNNFANRLHGDGRGSQHSEQGHGAGGNPSAIEDRNVVSARLGQLHVRERKRGIGGAGQVSALELPLVVQRRGAGYADAEQGRLIAHYALAGWLYCYVRNDTAGEVASQAWRSGEPVGGIISISGRIDALQRWPETVRQHRPRRFVIVANLVHGDVRHAIGRRHVRPLQFQAFAAVLQLSGVGAEDLHTSRHTIFGAERGWIAWHN